MFNLLKKPKFEPQVIIHVGPPKCGSSSIQQFFLKHPNSVKNKFKFIQLPAKDIDELDSDDKSQIESYKYKILSLLKNNDTVFLSHEYLFQCPNAVTNLCQILSNENIKHSVIGYRRRQSNYLKSAYAQWMFRSPGRVQSVINQLKKIGITPLNFTGVERQFIGSILNQYDKGKKKTAPSLMNWNQSYLKIESTVSQKTKVICSPLPKITNNSNLVLDFINKSNLELNDKFIESTYLTTNKSFHPELVEAINSSIAFGHQMPSPHENNHQLAQISKLIPKSETEDSLFFKSLKNYTDSFFLADNIELAKRHKFNDSYFSVETHINIEEVLDIIKKENDRRTSDNFQAHHQAKIVAELTRSLFKK